MVGSVVQPPPSVMDICCTVAVSPTWTSKDAPGPTLQMVTTPGVTTAEAFGPASVRIALDRASGAVVSLHLVHDCHHRGERCEHRPAPSEMHRGNGFGS